MRALLFLLSGSLLFAQLDSNSVTVTASRSIAIRGDQVLFGVTVTAPASAGLDDVLGALARLRLGVTASQLSSVNTAPLLAITGVPLPNPFFGPIFQWTFSVTEPITKLQDTVAALTALQNTIGQQTNGFSLTFGIQGTQASQQLIASQQCAKSDLIADATAQAQKLTNAAGVQLGPILALSSVNTNGAVGAFISIVPVAAVRSGDFTSISGTLPTVGLASFLLGGLSILPPPVQPVTCSLVVKFSLVRF